MGGEGEDLPVREGLNFVSVGCTVLSVCPGAPCGSWNAAVRRGL